MKIKNCTEKQALDLRKPSVKRMHRPHKFEAVLKGRAKFEALLQRFNPYLFLN